MSKRAKILKFVVCVRNDGYEASLEMRKLYRQLPDEAAAQRNLLRVIDESGEDYLYPTGYFLPIDLTKPVEKALQLTS